MPRTISLSIKEPCPVPLNTMDSTQVGFFCQQCQKEVVDFTGKSDSEIHQYFAEAKGKVCGRLRPDQVDRPISYSEKSGVFSIPLRNTAATLAIASSIGLDAHSHETDSTTVSQRDSIEIVHQDSQMVEVNTKADHKNKKPKKQVQKPKTQILLEPKIPFEIVLLGDICFEPRAKTKSMKPEHENRWDLPEFLKSAFRIVRFTGLFNAKKLDEYTGKRKGEKPATPKEPDPILHEDRRIRVRRS